MGIPVVTIKKSFKVRENVKLVPDVVFKVQFSNRNTVPNHIAYFRYILDFIHFVVWIEIITPFLNSYNNNISSEFLSAHLQVTFWTTVHTVMVVTQR